jgi:hypothetical protein
LTAAQVEVTVTSVPAEVKQEYTIYGVPLLKTPSYCTRVAPNAQSGDLVRKGEQVPDGKKTSLTAKFTKKNGQAQF